MDERGQFSYAFIFVIILMVLVFAFTFLSPMLQTFNEKLWGTTPIVINVAKNYATDMNSAVGAAFLEQIVFEEDSIQGNIDIVNSLIGFGGVFIAILVTFVFYLVSKRNSSALNIG